MEKIKIAIYGTGGFGREVAWQIEESNKIEKQYEYIGFILDSSYSVPRQVVGKPVYTLEHVVQTFPDVRVVVAIGDPNGREKVAKKVLEAGLAFETFVHPSVIRPSVIDIGVGSIICAGCILTTDIILGKNVVIIYHTSIGHDAIIDDYTTIGPGVRIAGYVTVGKRVFIGAGSIIINGTPTEPIVIGDDTVIGAGSCVIRSLPAGSRVFGNPARPIPK
jgi:sugar O-acyltransferase (sialic acid O-acetyltransferase NeuD family)